MFTKLYRYGRVWFVCVIFVWLFLVGMALGKVLVGTNRGESKAVDLDYREGVLADYGVVEPNRWDSGNEPQIQMAKIYGPDEILLPGVDRYDPIVKRREVVSARDSGHRVWEVIHEQLVADPLSLVETVSRHTSEVIGVGDGICYLDSSGDWQLTDARWREVKGGFVMDTAGYQLSMGQALGSWLEYTVAGDDLYLRPAAIKAYGDADMVTLAQVDAGAAGVIDPCDPSRLMFAGAFGSGIDLVLQVEPGGYHQDVIFRKKPNVPLDLTGNSTAICIYTELALDELAGDQGLKVFVGSDADV
ncbi:MAG: hypothetical protein GY869_10700, partial [Planctomycetes bacterium]|nr:hypothetical protein [Planctomycetota bacterium]